MKESIILSTKHDNAALINLCRGIESNGCCRHSESIDSNWLTYLSRSLGRTGACTEPSARS